MKFLNGLFVLFSFALVILSVVILANVSYGVILLTLPWAPLWFKVISTIVLFFLACSLFNRD